MQIHHTTLSNFSPLRIEKAQLLLAAQLEILGTLPFQLRTTTNIHLYFRTTLETQVAV
jgi:hypothetical protein